MPATTSVSEAKTIVGRIREQIEAGRNMRIWADYVNSLKLISQVVFTRSSGFILELLQNSEDAGHGMTGSGEFDVDINSRRARVTHNGRPFDEKDVESVCGVRSSKKPETGTLGYLGIGFKSVFKVSDCPEIYSGPFQFKFDRNRWSDPGTTPWHVIPLWIEEPSEVVDRGKTTFVIPFREEALRDSVAAELENLTTSLYLFLRWVRRISAHVERGGRGWLLENVPQAEGDFAVLKSNGSEERFKIFRRTVEVSDAPVEVKEDRLTQDYRANVTRRELAIAFLIDGDGNLAPQASHAMYGGVYSFLPLAEARSGARFPIQADFLVQPGRDAINYQAPWNRWLVAEVVELCKDAIGTFTAHPVWKYQYLQAFQFLKAPGLESYDQFFGPGLVDPIEKFLRTSDAVPLAETGWGPMEKVVVIAEGEEAQQSLVDLAVVAPSEAGQAFGGGADLNVADRRVKDGDALRLRRVDRLDLLSNSEFLEKKAKTENAPSWFRCLYLWLARNPRAVGGGRRTPRSVEGYWNSGAILTLDGKLETGGNVWLLDYNPADTTVSNLLKETVTKRAVLHPDIIGGAKDTQEAEVLRGFLTGRMGVQILDAAAICKEAIIPRIRTSSPQPDESLLLSLTQYCEEVLGESIGPEEIWVVSKGQGGVYRSREVVLPPEYRPPHDWERNKRFVPGIHFLSEKYLRPSENEESEGRWLAFFKRVGVKEAPDNGVKVFGQNFAREALEKQLQGLATGSPAEVTPVDSLNYGYDHVVVKGIPNGDLHVEVKGQTTDEDVTLTSNETTSADSYQERYYVCVVSGIPERPEPHFVRNPAAPGIGKKDTLRIPIRVWRERGAPGIALD
jgi:Domain of unknown function (DUF3883)